jgi:hypothetical protein
MLNHLLERRILIATLVLIVSIASASGQTAPTKLEAGKPIERTMGLGQSHTYSIILNEKQYLQFVVEQHGIDVMVQVFSPTGQSLARIDSPNGTDGPEHGSLVATVSGTYTIVVAPLDQAANEDAPIKSGRYEIKTVELRDATEQELKVGMGEGSRRAKAIALLNEVLESLPTVHQAQTRIRFKQQAAQLLWKTDEKRATKLLTESIKDSQDYLASLPLDADDYYEVFGWVKQIRYEGVQTLAAHDPEAALELFLSTRKAKAEGDDTESYEEKQFELSLAGQIAAKNPQRAFEMAEADLKSGYSPSLVQTIVQLRAANQDLSTKLSKALTAKLLSENLLANPPALEMALTLLRTQMTEKPSNRDGQGAVSAQQVQILSVQDSKALVQKTLNEALSFKPTATDPMIQQRGSIQGTLFALKSNPNLKIDELVPGSTAAIDKKLAELGVDAQYGQWMKYEAAINDRSTDSALETIGEAPDYMKAQLLRRLAEKTASTGDIKRARDIVSDNVTDPRERQSALIDLERQAAINDANHGRMEDALKHIAKLPKTSSRAEVISEIAGRIGQGQKTSTALQLLETAKSLLGTSIRSEGSEQMTALLKLAGAFARYDVKRALEIVEPLIEQFNELAEAAKVMNGFGLDYFADGELAMQNGNGLSMIATPLAGSLGEISIVDFEKAKVVSERISLPEVRLSLYLGMIQQVILPEGLYVNQRPMPYLGHID